eukprot:7383772-Prymnesium_polylepis.2
MAARAEDVVDRAIEAHDARALAIDSHGRHLGRRVWRAILATLPPALDRILRAAASMGSARASRAGASTAAASMRRKWEGSVQPGGRPHPHAPAHARAPPNARPFVRATRRARRRRAAPGGSAAARRTP